MVVTEQDKTTFCQITTYWNTGDAEALSSTDINIIDSLCEPEDVATTSESVGEFIKTWGRPHQRVNTDKGELLVWENIQTAKGRRRGDGFVVQFSGGCCAFFTGEV